MSFAATWMDLEIVFLRFFFFDVDYFQSLY